MQGEEMQGSLISEEMFGKGKKARKETVHTYNYTQER